MATVVTITKADTKESMQKKIAELNPAKKKKKEFNAAAFTGKIKNFGDGSAYQKDIRNDWE